MTTGTAFTFAGIVPYNLVHEVVEIRTTPTTVEILHKGQRVASGRP